MLVTLAGIDMLVISVTRKAETPILAHREPLANDTQLKLLADSNAPSPMPMTLAGMDMLVISVPWKA